MYLWLFMFSHSNKIYISTLESKSRFEKNIYQSISSLLVTYFYYTNVFQKLYSTYYKLNVSVNVFKMKDKKLFNLFSCVLVENYHILKGDFRRTTFLVYFNVFSPYCTSCKSFFFLQYILV